MDYEDWNKLAGGSEPGGEITPQFAVPARG
jgi:hypothetical protein